MYQYVIVGADYDHLGSNCRTAVPADTICNGATDTGAGVAALLAIAGMIKQHGAPLPRTVVLAAWDREEDDLGGSKWYVDHPLVPLAQTARVRQLRHPGCEPAAEPCKTSFAVGVETRGHDAASRRSSTARSASTPLQTRLVSADLRAGPQRLRELHQRVGAERLLQRLDRSLLSHPPEDSVPRGRLLEARPASKIGYQVVRRPRERGRPAPDVLSARTARDVPGRRCRMLQAVAHAAITAPRPVHAHAADPAAASSATTWT